MGIDGYHQSETEMGDTESMSSESGLQDPLLHAFKRLCTFTVQE